MKTKLMALVEQVIRSVSGGAAPGDSKYAPPYIAALIPQARQTALSIYYNGAGDTSGLGNLKMGANRNIPTDFFQSFTLYYDSSIQTSGAPYIKFSCPMPININRDVNGFSFVGDREKGVRFTRFRSPGDAAEQVGLGIPKINDIRYLPMGGELWVYGDKDLKRVDIDEVCSDPQEAPGFNPYTDDYPYPEELMPLLVQVLKRDYLREENIIRPDNIPNANNIMTK